MAMVKWSPVGDLANIQKELNRLFNEFLSASAGPRDLLEGTWNPSVDVSETETEVLVTAELPGMKQQDVKVDIHNNVLTISGEKKREEEIKGQGFHAKERQYGSFHRSFRLPAEVEAGKAHAKYRDGVLKVALPKAEAAKPRHIDIEVS